MFLLTAFLLGLVGSLHCVGMCGPLALAVPVAGQGKAAVIRSRLTYNFGRIATYSLMGVIFGMLGGVLSIAGLQRWVSLAAGVLILLGLLVSFWSFGSVLVTRWVAQLKWMLGELLQQRTHRALFGLGMLNGLLPCGLVYVACAAAVAVGGLWQGIAYMAAFGLGTLPMMFGLGLAGGGLQNLLRFRLRKLVPVSLAVVAALLILRGMALGIPYLSPPNPATGSCPACSHER